jgi:hypothetical protein
MTPLDYAANKRDNAPGPFARQVLAPPGRGLTAAAVITFLTTLYGASIPVYGNTNGVLLTCFLLSTFGLAWVCRVTGWLVLRNRYDASYRGSRSGWHFLVYPAVVSLGLLIAGSGLVSTVCFAASRPAMQRLVDDVEAGRVKLPAERRCGLYHVRITRHEPDDVGYHLWVSSFMVSQYGFFYAPPGGLATRKPFVRYHPYTGPWEVAFWD